MSCWRNVTNDCLVEVDIERFKQAVREIGLEIDESKKRVNAVDLGRNSEVDGVLCRNSRSLSLGVIYDSDEEHHLKIVGDFWNTGINEKTMMDNLTQEYVKLSLQYQLEYNMGYSIESCEMNEEGEYVIEACCG